MLENRDGRIVFSMKKFDKSIESAILMALIGAETPSVESVENLGTVQFAGDTINLFKDSQTGSRFLTHIQNSKATYENAEIANELLLDALDFLKNENIVLDITSEFEIIEEFFVFKILLTFNTTSEYFVLEVNTLKKIYNLTGK